MRATELDIGLLTRLFIAVYFIDTGLLLIVGPWTMWWQRNFFTQFVPWLPMFIASSWVRLGVAALGVITLWVGLADARRLIWPSSSRAGR